MQEKVINPSRTSTVNFTNSFNVDRIKSRLKIVKLNGNAVRSLYRTIAKHKLITAAIIIAIIFVFSARVTSFSTQVSSNLTNQNSAGASSVSINKEFNFPIYSSDGKTESKLKVVLTSALRDNKIIINGKTSQAAEGKDFLILNMEITNSTNNKLNVRPVDFFRMVGAEGQLFAADVYNDPVKVEPISIKKTRIAYVVFESQEKFKFQIGEIKGEKQEVEINI